MFHLASYLAAFLQLIESQTIVVRPEIGACAVVLNLGENVLDRLVLEVVEGVRSVEALADDEVGTDEIDEESVGTIMEENEE